MSKLDANIEDTSRDLIADFENAINQISQLLKIDLPIHQYFICPTESCFTIVFREPNQSHKDAKRLRIYWDEDKSFIHADLDGETLRVKSNEKMRNAFQQILSIFHTHQETILQEIESQIEEL